jgi:tripartite-type tricarboxylate transporter receptor subunit TctC
MTRVFPLALAIIASALPALAQSWPTRSLRIVVPFGPGGPTDVVARILANGLSAALGQPVVIENRGGAGGNIGVTAASRAPADGYTMLVTSTGFVINAGLFRNPGYDPVRDFVALTEIGASPDVFLARAESPIRSLDELVERARATAGGMHFTNPGTGSTPHLAGERLAIIKGIRFLQVANSSAALAVQALLAGNTEIGATALASSHSQIKAGRLRALALTGPERWFDMPDVPTMLELGYPDFVTETFHGLFTPAGTPDAAHNRFVAAIHHALKDPAIQARLEATGADPVISSPAAYQAVIAKDREVARRIVAATGLSIG